MELNEYQRLAHKTSHNTTVGGDALVYPVLGLVGEAGELANKVKKLHRDKGGVLDDSDNVALCGEMGDCIWYIAEICTQLGYDLDLVCRANIDKLRSRQQRGVIGGNGDNR